MDFADDVFLCQIPSFSLKLGFRVENVRKFLLVTRVMLPDTTGYCFFPDMFIPMD